ncbi:tyrosine-type recombinase/integrase [Sphingomonas sp. PAMC 26617]|uniref:tyrosine-type recombinase/integrase n=1 Tax=Sphingomonas sp. PAMC 26617 TaxID=1112216 RepID=UPI000287AE65|nr:tyrosine-type recombinase/integrase [Sphingomonas sp. PAMC 26617]
MADFLAPPSFPTLLQRFFTEYLREHRAVSPSTVAAYRDTFRLLLLFAQKTIGKSPTKIALADLEATLILAFLDHLERERGNTVRSRNARLSAIRAFLKYAAHQDLTALATIEHALAVPQKRCDKAVLGFLTRPEMEAIIDAPDRRCWAGQRDRALFTMLYNTGARVSEVIDLRICDVVLDVSPVAHLRGKGRKRRSVPIWKATAAMLRQWLRQLPRSGETDPLFPNSSGGRLSRSSVTERLALAVKGASSSLPQLANRPISPHSIRHTTAMHLLQAGVDITVIALWLGHESPTTTHIYLEADLAMKEEALSRLQPITAMPARYRAPDKLMAFLQAL